MHYSQYYDQPRLFPVYELCVPMTWLDVMRRFLQQPVRNNLYACLVGTLEPCRSCHDHSHLSVFCAFANATNLVSALQIVSVGEGGMVACFGARRGCGWYVEAYVTRVTFTVCVCLCLHTSYGSCPRCSV